MKHVIVVGLCYLDTILSVPHFPEEDSKLRATSSQVRRGGNCGNTLEVLQQLLGGGCGGGGGNIKAGTGGGKVQTRLHLLSPLPDASSPAAAQILDSFQNGGGDDDDGCSGVGSGLCLHRAGAALPASSYIIRSEATGSRTIVSQVPLAEMTEDEFAGAVAAFAAAAEDEESWWHFEGRIPETTLWCIRHLRRVLPSATVSVEVEKPGREGLSELAAEADVVFYSKSWAEARGYRGSEQCLRGEAPSSHAPRLLFVTWGAEGASAFSTHSQEYCFCAVKDVAAGDYKVVDTIGAGDTFIAGVIFDLFCRDGDEGRDLQDTLRFAVGLATRKVQIDGFGGLGGGGGGGQAGAEAGAGAGCE